MGIPLPTERNIRYPPFDFRYERTKDFMIKIEINGEPIPAARPRFSGRRAKRGREAISEVQTSGKEFRRRG